jgi:folate-dependent phosphoribosylglycinamide formyltransferase PurN
MNIVVFGLRYHPYTVDVLECLHERNLKPSTLIEFKPRYNASRISTSSDIDDEFLSKIYLKDIFSPWAIKMVLRHPFISLNLFLKIIRKKPDEKNQRDFLKGITVYSVDSHNDDKCIEILSLISPDVVVLAPASTIIRKNVLNIPKIGTVNAHMGKLPEFRGMNALEWTILKTKTGYVSVHFVDEGVDTGDILLVRQIPLNKPNLSEMRVSARKEMAKLIAEVLTFLPEGNINAQRQQNNDGKQYFTMHKKLLAVTNKVLERIVDR